MLTGQPENKIERLVIYALSTFGVLLYMGLQWAEPLLNLLSQQDRTIEKYAFSITMLMQISRGLLGHYQIKNMPQWLPLYKCDRRLLADSTVVFIVIFFILELTLRGNPIITLREAVLSFSTLLLSLYMILGAWLLALITKSTNSNFGLGLIATVVFMLVFLSPMLLSVGIAYAMYYFLHVQCSRDTETLAVSALMPVLIAMSILVCRDNRDRGKNTIAVIRNQLMTLPTVPLTFFALKFFWPQQLSVMVFPFIPLLAVMATALLPRGTKPWLVKEKVEVLQQQRTINKVIQSSTSPQFESEMSQIRQELAENCLCLKNADDHIDRADAFWKLGDLQSELSNSIDAEASYNEAINAYNQPLRLEPKNTKP